MPNIGFRLTALAGSGGAGVLFLETALGLGSALAAACSSRLFFADLDLGAGDFDLAAGSFDLPLFGLGASGASPSAASLNLTTLLLPLLALSAYLTSAFFFLASLALTPASFAFGAFFLPLGLGRATGAGAANRPP